jgi:hypothetical protein
VGGLRWWSWYNPDWYSYAIWTLEAVQLNASTLQRLAIDSESVIEAAEILRRPLRT